MLLLALLAAAVVLVSTGALTLDTGWGRRVRALGPLRVQIAAPRDVVFDVAAVPHASASPPRAIREKVSVVERAEGMVVAAHRTKAGLVTAVTVEAETLERPLRIGFRLLRGPVPHVVEEFVLGEQSGTTTLAYRGQRAVAASLAQIAAAAEERSGRRPERVPEP